MYLVAKTLDGRQYRKVCAYGFHTEDGAQEEINWILEVTDEDESDFEIMEYSNSANPKLYYDGENFSRSLSGAEART